VQLNVDAGVAGVAGDVRGVDQVPQRACDLDRPVRVRVALCPHQQDP
jgi:hypothetical protein